MNALVQSLASPQWKTLVEALLHTLWQGALVVVVLGLILRRSTRPAIRYHCTLGALIVVLSAGLLTWGIIAQSLSSQKPISNVPDPISLSTPEVPVGSAPTVVETGESTRAVPPVSSRWTAWLALAWLAGAGLMLIRAGAQVAGAEKLRRTSRPLTDPRFAQLLEEARRAMKLTRRIRLAITEQLTSPAVVGVVVPTLIVPLSLTTSLTPEQIRFILLHELAHIRRGDYLTNLFQLFAEALLFFNPAVWWISHQVRREREACCDALAIELSGAPADYARTLVHVAENALAPAPAAAPAFGEGRHKFSLAERVQRLLVPGYRPALRLTWRAMLMSLLLGGTLLMFSALGVRLSIAAVLSPQQRIDQIGSQLTPKAPGMLTATSGEQSWSNTASPLQITSGSSVLDTATGIVTVSNEVVITCTNVVIKADNATVDRNSGRITAKGNVRLDQSGKVTEGDSLQYNFKTGSADWQTSSHTPDFHIRRYRLDTKLFLAQLGATEASSPTNLPLKLLKFFADGGVNLSPDTGRNIFYSDSRGDLLVRATPDELDIVERLLAPVAATTNSPNVLVQDGRALLSEGRLDDADAKLKQALFQDPENKAALYYLDLVQQARNKNPGSPTTSTAISSSAAAANNSTNFQHRLFVIDRNAFASNLEDAGFVSFRELASLPQADRAGRAENLVQNALVGWFTHAGVDLRPETGKSVVFNQHAGTLFVRTTPQDLEIIQKAVESINRQPPQVHIVTKFIEVPQKLAKALQTKWPTSTLATTGAWSVALSPAQAKEFYKEISGKESVNLVNQGEVTTLHHRQAQIQVGDVLPITVGINPQALTPPGVASHEGSYDVHQIEATFTGASLDIVPSVNANGHTIEMEITPSVREFLGYDKPRASATIYVNGTKEKAAVPEPRFRIRQTTASASMESGQSLLFGGFLPREVVRSLKDTPVKTVQENSKKNLLVIVTATIIDSRGQPVVPTGN